ncbi:alpha/beta fold hydrolase [Inhella gelatinilytica]|uniref:Alpha/beta hydrolase n=1 Tax=Inhella gelatinilytica TaxID=2795030 RepID=A0A931IWH6_9BURK|nr:alpha/beta hydrolase [Inhella gelatinilytica]MBH9553434.1 alpha/beta hydrolase [Inhella gelatinilytica]
MHALHRFYASEDGLRLHVADYPGADETAPVLLCLPGLTRNGRDFAALAARLGPRYRVLCPDQRGRGLSAWDADPARYRPDRYVADMGRLLDELEVAQVTIIGTSLGGMMGIMLAAWQPARVRGVVLNDVGPVLDPAGLARIAGYVGQPVRANSLAEAMALTAAVQGSVFPDWTAADWRRMVLETWRGEGAAWVPDYDPAIAQGLANGSAVPPLWPLFEAVGTLPQLLLRGELSDLLQAETVVEMQQRLPGLQAVTVPNRGHAPTLDEPVAHAALEGWLAQVVPVAPTL